MSRNGTAARKQAEQKYRRIRGVGPGRPPISVATPAETATSDPSAHGVLARVIDVPASSDPTREVALRTLDRGGRFRFDALAEWDWEPGLVLASRRTVRG